MISDEDRERVRAATDLVALISETVVLKPRGSEFWGCCPFHGEKTASFHVIPATQVWHCFGCGQGGDCFTYIMKRENLSFPESIQYLADRANIEIHDTYEGKAKKPRTRRNRLIECCEASQEFFQTMLMRGRDARPREYFASRGFGVDVCKRYGLGYAPGHGSLVAHLRSKGFSASEMIDANVAYMSKSNRLVDRFYERVMFPIFDEQGRCIAFGGRIMGSGQPKYLNTAETSLFHKKKNLYAFNWAKEHIVAQGEAIVVEGYTDVIALHEAGIQNVVATLGTALTSNHVKTLTRFANRIIYLFDGDEAGQKAAERALQFVEDAAVDIRCVTLPDNADPMEYVTAHGAQAMRAVLGESRPLMDFVFERLSARSDTTTPGGRVQAINDAVGLLYPLRNSMLVDSYYMQVADLLSVDVEMIRKAASVVHAQMAQDAERNHRREQQYATQMQQRGSQSGSDAAYEGASSHVSAAYSGSFSAPGASGALEPAHAASSSSLPDDMPPYDDFVVEDEGYAGYDDYVPYDEVEAAVPSAASNYKQQQASVFAAMTASEKQSFSTEQELLTLMAASPDTFRPYADRIAELEFVVPEHQTIAFAILATPDGTAASDVMVSVRAACPNVSLIVSMGTIEATSSHPTATNIEFLLNSLELFSAQRAMQRAQSRLRTSMTLTDEERKNLTIEVKDTVLRVQKLQKSLGDVADPFKTL